MQINKCGRLPEKAIKAIALEQIIQFMITKLETRKTNAQGYALKTK